MKIQNMLASATLTAALAITANTMIVSNAPASTKVKLATKTVIQHGGPETRTRCIGYASGKWPWPAKGGWKTCNEWATDFKQHRVYVELYGPADMDGGQLTQIKDACMAAAVATGIATGGNKTAIVGAFGTCVKTTEVLAGLFWDVRIDVKTASFW